MEIRLESDSFIVHTRQAVRPVSPQFVGDRIFVRAPRGGEVEVCRSSHSPEQGTIVAYIEDHRDLVVVQRGESEADYFDQCLNGESLNPYEGYGHTWRALDGIDYASKGYTKFKRYWYDPNNRAHTSFMQPIIERTIKEEAAFYRTWERITSCAPSFLRRPIGCIRRVAAHILGYTVI